MRSFSYGCRLQAPFKSCNFTIPLKAKKVFPTGLMMYVVRTLLSELIPSARTTTHTLNTGMFRSLTHRAAPLATSVLENILWKTDVLAEGF
jgi:hypothetical protein